jgi:hypothetical protein
MAIWQADFHFSVAADDLPDDYRVRLSAVLPAGRSWSARIEQWGAQESDRIDVSHDAAGHLPEVFCRFDLREWKPNLYGRFIDCLREIGGRLETAEGEAVPLELAAFERVLLSSPAARFVADPRGFLEAGSRSQASE